MAADALRELENLLESDDEFLPEYTLVQEKLEQLVKVINDTGPNAREEAIQANAYEKVVKVWSLYCEADEEVKVLGNEAGAVREAVIHVLSVLTPGNPTIVDQSAFRMLVEAFDPSVPESTKIYALKLMRNICIQCEENREALTSEWDIIPKFVNVAKVDEPSAELIRQWCGALKAFTLNDDTTVAYNASVDRKRMIFNLDAISYLCGFLIRYNDVEMLNSIVIAISTMATNETHCIGIHAAGAISGLEQVLNKYPQNERLFMNTIKCIHNICVSGTVRDKVGNSQLVKVMLEAVNRMMDNAENIEQLMGCLAYMTLRTPCSAAQFLSEHGVTTTMEVMRTHMTNPNVLKGCCLLLRNVASLSGHIGQVNILDAGGEALLREAMNTHSQLAENHVKPALRDLGIEAPPEIGNRGFGYVPRGFDEVLMERFESFVSTQAPPSHL